MSEAPDVAAAPTRASERIELIDGLRGFALFGILLANFPVFAGLPMASEAYFPTLFAGIDPAAYNHFFNGVLDGKFYTIFSFLFGLGFALQLERLLQQRADGVRVFQRRTAVLLGIGLVHLWLWEGDILTWYALLGFTLPLFRKVPDRALLAIAVVLIFAVPVVLRDLGPALGAPIRAVADGVFEAWGGPAESAAAKPDYIAFIGRGGWREYLVWIGANPLYALADRLDNWRLAKVLGTMLIGLVAGRHLIRGSLIGNAACCGESCWPGSRSACRRCGSMRRNRRIRRTRSRQ